MKKLIGIAVATALSVGAAHASITPPGASQGELIEFVVDNSNGHVYARGLQISETSVLPSGSLLSTSSYASATPPVTTASAITSPIGPDGNLTTFLGQDGGSDTFSFALLSAGTGTGGASGFAPGANVLEFTSPNSIAGGNFNAPLTSSLGSQVTNVQTTVTTLNGVLPAAAGSSADVSAQLSGSSNVFALYAANVPLLSNFGTDVNLYSETGDGSKLAATQLYTDGLVTMTANGTLESFDVSPPPVPLPAAVWLLGSGILGLAGVGRRRSGSVVASAA